jgi:hypothetical protein
VNSLDSDMAEWNLDQIMWCCSDTHHEVQDLTRQIEDWRDRRQRQKSIRSTLGIAEDIEYYELDPQSGHQYIASWDLGKKPTKKGRNATVGMVWISLRYPGGLWAFGMSRDRATSPPWAGLSSGI